MLGMLKGLITHKYEYMHMFVIKYVWLDYLTCMLHDEDENKIFMTLNPLKQYR